MPTDAFLAKERGAGRVQPNPNADSDQYGQ